MVRCAILLLAWAAVTAAAEAPPLTVAQFAWLSGCWARENAEAGSEEHWTSPAGGMMLGMSRTLRDGKVRDYEFMEIREVAPGKLGYIAHPSRQAPATFLLTRAAQGEIVFENLQHDFPQRIIYRLTAPQRLLARIEGERQGKLESFDYPMRRKACATH